MVRSGLICSHVLPKSGVLKTTLPAKIDRRLVMRRKNDRRIPVETKLLSRRRTTAAAASPRIDRLLFASAEVGPDNVAALRLGKILIPDRPDD